MRGELVIVRTHNNRPLVRKVWSTDEKAVYITNDETFEQLLKGSRDVMPVGFSKDDIFKYDPALIEEISLFNESKAFDWTKLTHWKNL